MIEIQCTSCHTRYRIDERVLPDDTPTFKCSRCGHVFNADPVPAKARKAPSAGVDAQSRSPRTPRPRASAPRAATPTAAAQRSDEPETPAVEHASAPEQAPAEPAHDDRRFEEPHIEGSAQHEEPAPQAEFDEPEVRTEQSEVDEPLDRMFADRNQKADTGDNLRFDFSDDRHHENKTEARAATDIEIDEPEPAESQWQVGDTTPEFEEGFDRDEAPAPRGPIVVATEPPIRKAPRAPVRHAPAPQFSNAHFAQAPDRTAGFVHGDDSDDMPYLETGRVHSAGYFVGMFFSVAVAFLGASIFICSEPVSSARLLSQAPRIGSYFARPIVPAMLVAMRDVTTGYRKLKDGQVALVVSGSALNVGNRPLHLVEIGAEILDESGHALRRQSVYCGNELSAAMLGQMTPREIEFSQDLSPQKSFAIAPSGAAPFLMVFINPPQPAGQLRMTIAKAIAAELPAPAATARR